MCFDSLRRVLVAILVAPGLSLATGVLVADTGGNAAVREVITGIIAADNAEDIERVLGHYASDAVLIVPDGPDVAGLAAIREHYEKLFANADFLIVPRIDEIVIDGNLAIVRGVNSVRSTTADSAETVCVASKFLTSLKRIGKRWKIVQLMWSNQSVPC